MVLQHDKPVWVVKDTPVGRRSYGELSVAEKALAKKRKSGFVVWIEHIPKEPRYGTEAIWILCWVDKAVAPGMAGEGRENLRPGDSSEESCPMVGQDQGAGRNFQSLHEYK